MISSGTRWSVLTTTPATGAENMALDEALMDRATATGEWTLRIYSWKSPTLSLGRNQTARGRYDMNRLLAEQVDVVRRPTGGRAILHDREITYSVTAPLTDAGDLQASYDRINRLLLLALETLGVGATVASATKRAAAPGLAPCFDEPSAGELMVEGRKLAGSAQWRSDTALLQHGSILVADDQSELARFVIGGARPIPQPATLAAVLGRTPTIEEVSAALLSAVRSLEDPDAIVLNPADLDQSVRARASTLVVRYMDDDWTWRR
jgi:lipoate-protein ligase A